MSEARRGGERIARGRLSGADRARAWLVTGPLARLAAFGLELGGALRGRRGGDRG